MAGLDPAIHEKPSARSMLYQIRLIASVRPPHPNPLPKGRGSLRRLQHRLFSPRGEGQDEGGLRKHSTGSRMTRDLRKIARLGCAAGGLGGQDLLRFRFGANGEEAHLALDRRARFRMPAAVKCCKGRKLEEWADCGRLGEGKKRRAGSPRSGKEGPTEGLPLARSYREWLLRRRLSRVGFLTPPCPVGPGRFFNKRRDSLTWPVSDTGSLSASICEHAQMPRYPTESHRIAGPPES